MDLLDRYLNTVRWNLPRYAKADDIIAELRDVISAQVEEKEDRLGRALTKDEWNVLLRDFGHPLVVAARYGSQQWLIGPETFPFYQFAVKVVIAISLAVAVISSVAHALFSAAPGRALAHIGGDVFWTVLGNVGLMTVIFAIVEHTGLLTRYLARWRPDDLPGLRGIGPKPKSAWETMFEVAVGVALILWWVGVIQVPILYTNMQGLVLTPAPIWAAMWTPILVLLVARLVFNLIQWVRPRWKWLCGVLAVGTASGTLVLLGLIYAAGRWVSASSATMPAAKVAEIDRSTNLGVHYAIIVVAVIVLFQCGQELWRLARARN